MLVLAQPARIPVHDVLHLGQALEAVEQLVDLLLVLGDDEPRVAVVDHVRDLVGAGVLVEPHRGRSRRLRGDLRDHPLRPVVAEDGYLVAARNPQRGEP